VYSSAFAVFAVAALPLKAADVTVFAAISLAESLKEIASGYEKESGDKIIFNLAGSNILARQIEEGAPADIFFSADEAKMDALAKKGLIVNETRLNRLANALVIVTSSEGPQTVHTPVDLAKPEVKHVALADPAAVPAGLYAKQYLSKLHLWDAISPKVIPLENVRAALAAVAAGNADAGIVYNTDAAISKNVRVAYEVPADAGPAIRYPMALLKDAKELEAARRFLTRLASTSAAEIFKTHGFIVLDPPPKK
jgi:molybdate transport system substrate-binding protein